MTKSLILFVLMFSSVMLLKAQMPSIPFVEGFEHGLNKWVDLSTAGTVEATTTENVVGAQSLHITGTGAGAGIQVDFTTLQEVNVISYYVRITGANGGLFKAGNGHSGNNAVFSAEILGGNFVVTTAAGPITLCPVASNKWIHVEVKNINYMTHTLDVFIDGVLLGSKIGFEAAVPGISTIDIYNQSGADEAWWDAIYLGTDGFELPEVDGYNSCANDTAHLTFSPAIALDSAGINIAGTNLNIGPIANDSMVDTKFPYLETAFDADNGLAGVWDGNMFNLTAKKDIAIYGFDINMNVSAPASAKVYYRKGTYVGHNTSNAGWLLLDSVDVVPNPTDGPTWLELTKSLVIPQGETYGIYICTSNGIDYTDGNGTNETKSNDDITFNGGVSGGYFSLTIFPRIWNGRIYYKTAEAQKEEQVIETTFANNNVFGGNMFDVYAKNDIVVDSLNVNIDATTGWLKVYYREGTCVGFNTANTGWAKLDSIQVTGAGSGLQTKVVLNNKLYIPAGHTYGIYVCSQASMYYTNIIAGTNDIYIDSNMVLTGKYGGDNVFSCPNSRVWNGTLYYSVRNVDASEIGTETSNFVGNVRGYCFVAPKDFHITGVMVPADVAGDQAIEILRFADGLPPVFSIFTNNFVSLGYWKGVPQGNIIPCDIFVAAGDVIGVYGCGGTTTSYCNTTTSINILGDTAHLTRSGMQHYLTTQQMAEVWSEPSNLNLGRINLYVEPVTLHGGIDSVMIDVQTPTPDLGPDGDYCVQNTVVLDPGAFSYYDWSTMASSPTITVDSTGTGLGNSVQYSVTVTDMYGCTASDTITITFVDCTSIEENDMSVKVYPNPSDDIFYISTENVNEAMFVQVFSLDGRLVKELNVNSPLEMIDMSSELPGVYSIRMTIKDQVKEMRIVLQ
jgi:hypothetical protein